MPRKKKAAVVNATSDDDGDDVATTPAPPKRRGRPKKQPDDSNTTVAAPAAPTKKRGRPKKTTADNGNNNNAAAGQKKNDGKAAKRGSNKNDDSGIDKKKTKGKADKDTPAPTAGTSKPSKDLKIPIDSECTLRFGAKVFDGYNAMLNQTNISANNNKFYVLQVLEKDAGSFYAWFRWGRVGRTVGTTLDGPFYDSETAVKSFSKKFKEKTGNKWEDRHNFEKKKGKYDMLEMDYGESDEEDEKDTKPDKPEKKEVASKLHPKVQSLIKMIFNTKEWEEAVKEMQFDIKKAPLGKLTKKQITNGYESLKRIAELINSSAARSEIEAACSEFYTRIPHDFGMKRPHIITTAQEVKKKIELIEALNEIQIALGSMDKKTEEDVNVLDANYATLNCDITPLDHSDKQFEMVQKYLANTHASTHNWYNLKLEEVYEIHRESDKKRFKEDIGNRMLLWHGSRLTNWCGILGQGLRIAPPEAPVTGYMFGKGVYFADMVSKSANYCYASQRQPYGFLLLCDVALGNMNEKTQSDYYAANLPKNKHSTKGLGKTAPDSTGTIKLEDGIQVPMGVGKPADCPPNCYLLYNEYIVYDVCQIRPRYLVNVKFDFKYNRW